MSEKLLELENTQSVLGDINQAIGMLDELVLNKKNEMVKREKLAKAQLEETQNKLEKLQATSEDVISNIDDIISKLYKILENNGTDNNNN